MRLVAIVLVVLALACEGGKGGGFPDGGFGGDGGSGAVCGGFSGQGCPPDEFCDFGRNGCGFADETGTCRPRPQGCRDVFDPVCGCDNQIHGNECDANAAGVDVNAVGTCPLEPGMFACGFRQCEIASQYCQRAGSDIGGEPDGFSCRQLPSCPGEPSCGCLLDNGEPCADNCSGDAAIGLTVTCLGG